MWEPAPPTPSPAAPASASSSGSERARCCLLQVKQKAASILHRTSTTTERRTRASSRCQHTHTLTHTHWHTHTLFIFLFTCVCVSAGGGTPSTCAPSVTGRSSVCGVSTASLRSSATLRRPIRRWLPSTGSTCDVWLRPPINTADDWLSVFVSSFLSTNQLRAAWRWAQISLQGFFLRLCGSVWWRLLTFDLWPIRERQKLLLHPLADRKLDRFLFWIFLLKISWDFNFSFGRFSDFLWTCKVNTTKVKPRPPAADTHRLGDSSPEAVF